MVVTAAPAGVHALPMAQRLASLNEQTWVQFGNVNG